MRGMNVTATREAMGLNKSELAERLGVSPSTVSRLEAGEIVLNLRTRIAIEAIARTLGVEVVE